MSGCGSEQLPPRKTKQLKMERDVLHVGAALAGTGADTGFWKGGYRVAVDY